MDILKTLKGGKSVLVQSENERLLNNLPDLVEYFVPSPEEGSPRILILCPNDELAREVDEHLKDLAKKLDLTVDLLTDKGNSLKQRNDLYFGTEIIVGSVKKVNAMYLQNGFNVALLKCCVVLQMDETIKKGMRGQLVRIAESLPKKCLYAISHQKNDIRIDEFLEQYVPNRCEI
jgi:superfamily II DNA/RNA helicase